ncbi:MAG: AAA family ATPase [Planctomycetota bacterium]
MITRVTVEHFKRFEREVFDLADHVVLAGPNNSGKTTLLQAIAVWNLAAQKWTARRGSGTSTKAKERTGVPITRKEFTAVPLREMKLLWHEAAIALRKEELKKDQKAGAPRVLTIALEGRTAGEPWTIRFEFRCSGTELLYAKPAPDHVASLQNSTRDITVVHMPPFSGIGAEETRYDRPYQDLLIGQGKPGDILRNLLLEVHENAPDGWKALCKDVKEIFGHHLLPPKYEGRPFILAEYLPGIPARGKKNGLSELDVSSAGSGFHQVLLLLGFLYARPSTVLLLDEPDAHLHVILQKQIYDRLRRLAAERGSQLIIATHSEILIDGTSPDQILSFYSEPHRLVTEVERDQVREALKRLSAMDILLAEQAEGVLYVENESDFNLLRAWARVMDHPTYEWFTRRPFWHANQGRNPREAREHFFALRAIQPDLRAYLLLDGDNRGLSDREVRADGLVIGRWKRYEAESYLIHPTSLNRFIETMAPRMPLLISAAERYLKDELPPAVIREPLGEHDYLNVTPTSKTILPGFFKAAGIGFSRTDFYLIAEQMEQDEICSEVGEKLDDIGRSLGLMK